MGDASKVRLVRCPKCTNLLPELPEYSVYECGGCGAVLRAKERDIVSDVLSGNSGEEKGFQGSEKLKNLVDKRSGNINFISGKEREDRSDEIEINRRKERAFVERESSLSDGFNGIRLEQEREIHSWTRDNRYMEITRPESVRTPRIEEVRTRQRTGEENYRLERLYRTDEQKRLPNYSYRDEGPSNYDPYAFHGHGIQKLEQERAELLRKLDDLKDQINRSYHIEDKPSNISFPNHHRERNFFQEYDDLRKPQHRPYRHVSPPEYYRGNYRDFDPDHFAHENSCSCLTCYNRNHRVPYRPPDRYQHVSPSELDPEIDGYGEPRRMVVANKTRRHCRPVSGGAPFIACENCTELLKLPRKMLMSAKNNKLRLRCGSCSSLIFLKIENNKLVTSLNSDCVEDFKSAITEHDLPVEENEKRKGSSSSSSKEAQSIDYAIARDDYSESAELRLENVWKESDSPEHRDSRFVQANNIIRKDSVGNASEAVELDVSLSETRSNMSKDFEETSEDESRSKFSKASDSFLVGLIKKSFRDVSRSSHGEESERPKVFINGQPLPDRVVKRAEKHAGPIHPGDYWYDFRAGFWGVMGQPCLGIIPPYIGEFNYPMPTNCCAGNTGVYINGRELDQGDLDLLACRGLPTARDKFYIVEISGKVFDEDTGQELDNLGKLAPTVEKTKQGFGMRVPKGASPVS